MDIILARTAGFCFGVKRAIDMAYQNARPKTYSYGQLIHNSQVTADLEAKGINQVFSFDDLPPDSRVIIRSHGVGKDIFDMLDGIEVLDATCPYVTRIHKIVNEYHSRGYQIVIFGDENHAEVIGINGWCGNTAKVFSKSDDFNCIGNICLVSQTTANIDEWEYFKKNVLNTCQDPVIFDTICNATSERQNEAANLAAVVDAMVVVGGQNSSNTKKLAEVCGTRCQNVFLIETAKDLQDMHKYRLVGVTAGASTPDWIIKEVINTMSEEKELLMEKSFAEQLDETMITLSTGDIVKGRVIGITPTEVYINLGYKSDGFIPIEELSTDPTLDASEIVSVGDEIDVFVVRVNDVEGTVKLSRRKLDQIAGWKKLEQSLADKSAVEGKVTEAVNGGIIVTAYGSKVFVPASQASTQYVEDLSSMIGRAVKFRVIEINPKRKKLIGSIKAVAGETRKQQNTEFWSTATVGQSITGTVKSVMDFGVFVDIGGVDGLVHISELSWSRIKHPSEVMSVGDTVDVFIKALDPVSGKTSLGYRREEDNPWKVAETKLSLGDVVTCKVVRIVPFGAFAEIFPNIDGLIHVSQISLDRIPSPSSVLKIGQEIEAKIVALDWSKQQISLSMKVLHPDYVEPIVKEKEEDLPPVTTEEVSEKE